MDLEARKLIAKAYQATEQLIKKNMAKLDLVLFLI